MSNDPDSPEDVRRELLWLRKGVGFSEDRLKHCPALCSVLGTPPDPTALAVERFESAVASLHDQDMELLRQIYGLDHQGEPVNTTLTGRRDAIGQRLGIGREAVADRDSKAIEKLLYQLHTGWYPKSPVPMRIPESHNGLVNHFVRVSTVVRNRRHVLSRHHYRFMTTFDGAEYIALAAACPTIPEVTLGGFRVETIEAAHGHVHRFWHHEPMRRGVTYDLAFVVRNPDPDSDPYWLTEESLAFHEPTRSAEFEVRFEGGLPERIWAFNGLTGKERPGRPEAGARLNAARGKVSVDFRDLHGGLYAGVAWTHSQTDV